ncbi:MAG: hypothetical protein JSV89_12015 [Spirochaetaceae bacterium]|nr:MAG: hypothetical protein JSV89_12015 [Spirochaetaceae bacterium]
MIPTDSWRCRYGWCAVFAIAFAYIESSVVVYLRTVYYPEGFTFPLKGLGLPILLIEAGRELATIVVLAVLSRLAEKMRKPRFFLFLYCFGIWDIFYYLWLKVLLDWPSTLLDWDVLFLIPLPWVGPVLSPLLTSLLFIAAAVTVTHLESQGRSVDFRRFDWLMGLAAALIVVGSYLWESGSVLQGTVPQGYPWWLWCAGIGLGLAVFLARVLQSGRTGRT